MIDNATSARKAEIDARQAVLATLLKSADAEGILLLMPAHVAWFTVGMNVRGLFADSERPGIYSNGRQRWLVCSNTDTQRLFDEELDGLGFQLKEWRWESGRSELLAAMTAGKKVIADRPFPNTPMANDHLRPMIRVLSPFEQSQYALVGKAVAHAVEATARGCEPGLAEAEIAGQLGHRLLRHGVEPTALSVTADHRGDKYRRPGFGSTPVTHMAVIQATGHRDGLYVSCSRSVCFGPARDEFRLAHDLAVKQSALYRSLSRPGVSIPAIGQAGHMVLANSPHEFDWRKAPPGYASGRFPAEELRRAGQEDPLAAGMAVVWQPRVGATAVVDTLLVTEEEPITITPPEDWPLKRISVRGGPYYDIPDLLIRSTTTD